MDTKSKRAVLDKLLDSNRKTKRISFAARVGWYRGGYHKYVLANGVIGTADSEVAIRPPRLKSPGHAAAIGRRGEHAEWLRTVAAHAKFSSRMLFAISAALAAPLLGMAKLPSF